MAKYYDARETRDPAERERDLLSRLPQQIAHAQAGSPYFAEALAQDEIRDAPLPATSSSRRPRAPKDHVTLRGERTIVRTFDVGGKIQAGRWGRKERYFFFLFR